MRWEDKVNSDSLSWLLEVDEANPGVRYFALRELEDRDEDDPAVRAARKQVMATGPVRPSWRRSLPKAGGYTPTPYTGQNTAAQTGR